MGIKTIAHVRSGSHRFLAVKAMMDGQLAGKSHEAICAGIFTAVSTNGGVITPKTAYAWYANLQVMIKNEDGSDICPPAPAKAPKAKAEAATAVVLVPAESPTEVETPADPQQILADLSAEIGNIESGLSAGELGDVVHIGAIQEEIRVGE
jgi:hypothetical protein